jgi:hypothetical protein
MALLLADLLKANSTPTTAVARSEFGKLAMEVFAMINTNVRQNRQDRDDPDTYFHPLSAVLKPRDVENIVADERHVFRGRTPLIARTEAFQYYPALTVSYL